MQTSDPSMDRTARISLHHTKCQKAEPKDANQQRANTSAQPPVPSPGKHGPEQQPQPATRQTTKPNRRDRYLVKHQHPRKRESGRSRRFSMLTLRKPRQDTGRRRIMPGHPAPRQLVQGSGRIHHVTKTAEGRNNRKRRPTGRRCISSMRRSESRGQARAGSIPLQASPKPRTAATELSNIFCSSALSLMSTIRSMPPRPMTVGTPT